MRCTGGLPWEIVGGLVRLLVLIGNSLSRPLVWDRSKIVEIRLDVTLVFVGCVIGGWHTRG